MITGYFEPSEKRDYKPQHDKKVIVDAILYVVKKWLGNSRRLAKEMKILTEAAENMARIAVPRLTLTIVAMQLLQDSF